MKNLFSESFTPHWDLSLTNEEYHADKTAVSSTSLKKILKSDKQFYSAFKGKSLEQTPSMLMGTLLHGMVLEKKDLKSMYTFKENKTDQKIYRNVMGMYEAVQKHSMASLLLSSGRVEQTGFYVDPDTGIKCKIRPDLFDIDSEGITLVDLKTCVDCDKDAFERQSWSYRYDFSLQMYVEGINLIEGQYPKHIAIVAVANAEPYEVAVFDMVSMLNRNIAKHDYDRALKRLKKAIGKGTWGDRHEDVTPLGYPAWVERLELESE